MKSYTNIKQSKKLAEILPIDSADMSWAGTGLGKPFARTIPCKGYPEEICPCRSLAALLDVYPMVVGKDLDMYCCWQNSKNLCSKHYDNPVDAVVELIMKLHEQKLI